MSNKKHLNRKITLLVFFLFLFQFNFLFINSLGVTKDISGNYVNNDIINPNQTVFYNFTNNNVLFGISTDSYMDTNIDLDPSIFNRESLILITNENNPLSVNFTLKSNMEKFNLNKTPKRPSDGNLQYRYRFNHIINIRSNISIQNLTIRYKKSMNNGLKPNFNYKIVLYEEGANSWQPLKTVDKLNDSSGEIYLEAQILTLNADEGYYITLFEINTINYDWIWYLLIFMIVGVSALTILLSKREFLQFLKTRTIPIDKGAHNLSLEDVLENENRNKIIDLVLEEPGIHFNELLRKTELSAGNLAWHLDILETYKVIGKKRIERYLVYFPYYPKNPLSNIDLKLRKSELTLKILEMIEEEPGIYNNRISKDLRVDHKTIHYHINKLVDLNLINIKLEGKKKKLYPNLDSEYYNNLNNT